MIGIHAIKPSRIAEIYLLAAMASKTGFNESFPPEREQERLEAKA